MSLDDNKRVARAWFDLVMNGRDVSAIDRFYADDYVYHGPDRRGTSGREQAKEIAARLIDAMPDRISTVEEQVAEDNRVVTRWVSCGTPTKPLMGSPPSGRPVVVYGITISRIEEGQIVDDWEILRVQEVTESQ